MIRTLLNASPSLFPASLSFSSYSSSSSFSSSCSSSLSTASRVLPRSSFPCSSLRLRPILPSRSPLLHCPSFPSSSSSVSSLLRPFSSSPYSSPCRFFSIAIGQCVVLSNGTNVPIENMKREAEKNETKEGQEWEEEVLSYNEEREGVERRSRARTRIKEGESNECIELTLEDGRSVICTRSQLVLAETENGEKEWVKAGELSERTQQYKGDKIVVSLEGAKVEYEKGTEKAKEEEAEEEDMKDWSVDFGNEEVGKFRLSWSNEWEKQRTMAFYRILGFLMTSGGIYSHSNGGEQACVQCSHLYDAQLIQKDIQMVTGEKRKIIARKEFNNFRIDLSRSFVRQLIASGDLVLQPGPRMEKEYTLPQCVVKREKEKEKEGEKGKGKGEMKRTCPSVCVIEFLGGMMGGSGRAPRWNKRKVKKKGKKNERISSWIAIGEAGMFESRNSEQKESLIQGMNTLIHLFNQYGQVKAELLKSEQREEQWGCHLVFRDIVAFNQRIGVRYSINKSMRFTAASSLYSFVQKALQQRNRVVEKIKKGIEEEGEKEGRGKKVMKLQEMREQAKSEVEGEDGFLYFPANIATLRARNRLYPTSFLHLHHEQWVKERGILKIFSGEEEEAEEEEDEGKGEGEERGEEKEKERQAKGSFPLKWDCVKADEDLLPTFALRLLHTRTIDTSLPVYDLTVPGEHKNGEEEEEGKEPIPSYLVNGVIVRTVSS